MLLSYSCEFYFDLRLICCHGLRIVIFDFFGGLAKIQYTNLSFLTQLFLLFLTQKLIECCFIKALVLYNLDDVSLFVKRGATHY